MDHDKIRDSIKEHKGGAVYYREGQLPIPVVVKNKIDILPKTTPMTRDASLSQLTSSTASLPMGDATVLPGLMNRFKRTGIVPGALPASVVASPNGGIGGSFKNQGRIQLFS